MTQSVTDQNVRSWNGLTVPATGKFALDPQHTVVGFVAKHMMVSKVRGHFAQFNGTLNLAADPTASTIEVTIKLDSVTTGADDRNAHLRSADFFDIENHPEMTFHSTAISHVAGSDFVVAGYLTIRGVTKQVELDATFEGVGVNPWGVQVVGFSANTEINREDWGLTWNAALETGGVLVGKTIKIEIEAEFNPAS